MDDPASRLEPGRPLRISGPTEIAFQHTIAFSPCPQTVAQLALKNTGIEDLLWSAFTPSLQLDIVPDSGLLLPGRSVPVIVSYNCTVPFDLTSFIEFAILDGDRILVVQRIPVGGEVD